MKRKKTHILNRHSNRGFTIVELLVAMVVSLLALAAIYSTFQSQHRSYQVQRETSEMQQNIRTAMYYLERDIRMAGSNPFKTTIPFFGITAANATSITFNSDIDDGAGGPPNGFLEGDETIQYRLNAGNLIRNTPATGDQMVAQNIDAIDFVYLNGNSPLNSGGGGVALPSYGLIQSVEITIVARTTDQLLYGTTNNTSFFNQREPLRPIYIAPGDRISRRSLTTTINCRNLGL